MPIKYDIDALNDILRLQYEYEERAFGVWVTPGLHHLLTLKISTHDPGTIVLDCNTPGEAAKYFDCADEEVEAMIEEHGFRAEELDDLYQTICEMFADLEA